MYEIEKEILFDFKYIKKIKNTYYEIKEVYLNYNKDDALKLSFSLIEKEFNDKKIHTKEKIAYFVAIFQNYLFMVIDLISQANSIKVFFFICHIYIVSIRIFTLIN